MQRGCFRHHDQVRRRERRLRMGDGHPTHHLEPLADLVHHLPHVAGSGAEKLANYFVGQIVGHMNHVKPAATVVYEMVDEFIDAINSVQGQMDA